MKVKLGESYHVVGNDRAKVTIKGTYSHVFDEVEFIFDADPYKTPHIVEESVFLNHYEPSVPPCGVLKIDHDGVAMVSDGSKWMLLNSGGSDTYNQENANDFRGLPKMECIAPKVMSSCTCGAIYFGAAETGPAHSSFCSRRKVNL